MNALLQLSEWGFRTNALMKIEWKGANGLFIEYYEMLNEKTCRFGLIH